MFEVFEVELGFGVELVSIEEDEEGEGAGWFGGGDEVVEEVVIEVDYAIS